MEAFKNNKDVMLRVIELVALESVKALRQVPIFRDLIIRYQRSIVKTRHRAYTVPASYAGSPALLVYRIPGGPNLYRRDQSFVPAIVSIHDWRSLKVAQAREDEIEVLLNAPFLRLRQGPGPDTKDFTWPRLNSEAKNRLRDVLKKGFYICDALRDMEAKAVVDLDLKVDHWCFDPHTWNKPHLERPVSSLNVPYPEFQGILKEFTIPLATRRLQNAFLEGLPDSDLVAIYTLTRIVTESWHEVHIMPPHGNPNSSLFERELTFRETLLRHGSWFLFCEVRGFSSRACHRKRLLEAVEAQVVGTDTLLLRQPSLVSTLNDKLHKRLKVYIGTWTARFSLP